MVLVEGAQDKVITYINEEAKKKREQGASYWNYGNR